MANTPVAFLNEPYKSLVVGPDLLPNQIPGILNLSPGQVRALQDIGLLKVAKCGRLYSRRKMVAVRWALDHDNWFSELADYWLERN